MILGRGTKSILSNILGGRGKKIVKPPVIVVTPPPVDGTIDSSINPPSYKLASSTVYPIRLNFLFDETINVDDYVEIQFASDRTFLNQTAFVSRQLTTANINGTLPVYTDAAVTGIVSPVQTYIRARIKRGTVYSNWGTLTKHGDSIAPTITSSASVSFPELSPILHTLTADEYTTWKLSGGDAALLEIANGNQVRLANNASPDYSVKNSYSVTVTATDDSGNQKTQQLSIAIISADRVPAQFNFTALTQQNPSSLVLSNLITITDLGASVNQAATITGPVEYEKNASGTWLPAGALVVKNNDTIRLRGTTGAYSTGFSASMSVGGVTSTWNVSVKDNPVGVVISSGNIPTSVNANYDNVNATVTITTVAGELWIIPPLSSTRIPQGATVDGVAMTEVVKTTDYLAATSNTSTYAIYKKTVSAGTHTVVVTYDYGLGNGHTIAWFTVSGHGVPQTPIFHRDTWASADTSLGTVLTIPTNGAAAIVFDHDDGTTNPQFKTGVVEKGVTNPRKTLVGAQVASGDPQGTVTGGGEPHWWAIVFPPA